ncbi:MULTISPECIES: helix-turn-helix transcriptional regulator [Providencia]|uniref:AraC family transcriptional regulator n=3 Tax=Morganellaceae TaxID=1903414 RepID=A0AA42K354_9GAMM|nr:MULTISPECIES: helix-turn-helix domain-containing protein [Providencia]MBC8652660.1 helix-turn-helix transcriptional regulator [Providencia vermicola]AVL72680.1 AraC family transcriptional regulator [Providencia rettgeri]EIL1982662.1 helix-turn-helix transcriptional regulator [Providencia rettgeri]EIU9514710.1 helix-turn-helix transcriptional regulator [Providencia rettgeri]EJD6041785.1 helix-turn-helix transcriptional regulator [Providencia rettgeri]
MEYKYFLSESQMVLKAFYIESAMIAMLCGAKGNVVINGQSIDISSDITLIMPKYSQVSCNIVCNTVNQPIEIHTLSMTEFELQAVFLLLITLMKSSAPLTSHQPIYHVSPPETVRDNFSLLKQCLPLKKQSESQEALLMKQSLYFILMAIYQEGVDILTIFRFNYDEPKNQAITHLITQEPQKKWSLDDVAKALFTTPSTLRRHLNREGVSFRQLLLDVRMGMALNYLTFSNYSVYQISHRCGFGSNAYFCDVFKRKYNMTPSQFRLQSRQSNDPAFITTLLSSSNPIEFDKEIEE